jgi:hypothetical protein
MIEWRSDFTAEMLCSYSARPVGTISTQHLQQTFMSRFGRELHRGKPISQFINPAPLVVALDQSMAEASQ